MARLAVPHDIYKDKAGNFVCLYTLYMALSASIMRVPIRSAMPLDFEYTILLSKENIQVSLIKQLVELIVN